MAESTSTMSTQFSKDGKYFAQITTDGKLKIWETATSTFKQEFVPNLHLTTPCTCLHWIEAKPQTSWKKRKRRSSSSSNTDKDEETTPFIALGTTSGSLLLYSVASAQVESTVDSNTSHSISCITWECLQDVYCGAEQFILLFDLKEKTVKSKWKAGTEKINSILIVPDKQRLLTASRTIQLWDLNTQEIIKTFTGHSSDVNHLQLIRAVNTEPYFISASTNDRLLSCWTLNEKSREKNAIASLLMEDVALGVTLIQGQDNVMNLAAVTRSGVTHVYQHTLNGKCAKPIKPKVTIQVASDTGQSSKDPITPIPIIAALFHEETSLMLAHGNNLFLTFENIVPNAYEKIQCLIRKDPRILQQNASKENDISKTRSVAGSATDYLTPYTSNNFKTKRKMGNDVKTEVPMEQRLENLTLNKRDGAGSGVVPKQDNLAQLLVQGLHSKDKTMLQSVLCKRDETIVRNTVKRLPMQVVVPLLTELTGLVQGRTLASQTGVLWLRYLIQLHAGQLLANPQLIDMIGPILGTIENRLSLLTPLSRLRGRLDLLVSQISDSSSTNNKDAELDEALLVFKDQGGSSDSESDENIELNLHSDSENEEWVEEEDSTNNSNAEDDSSPAAKVDENNVVSDDDSDMSM